MVSTIITALVGVLCTILSSAATFFLTRRKYNSEVDSQVVKNVKDAFERAREEQKSDILFCVGSLYLIGELKKVLRSLK